MKVSTRQQIWKDMYGEVTEKEAELAQTYDMPGSAPQGGREKDKKSVIKKTAGAPTDLIVEGKIDFLKVAFEVSTEPDDNEDEPVKGEQPAALPQAGQLKPKVDVSGQEPPKLIQKKEAQYYALPSQKKYPMDGYDQVKVAVAYFDEWQHEMPPAMRREFALNMVKRAEVLGIHPSDLACHYGGSRAGLTQIKVAFDARRSVLRSGMDSLDGEPSDTTSLEVLEKLASGMQLMNADALAACLTEFDRMTGLDAHWGNDVPDPYYSVFAKTAQEQESETDAEESIIVGNEYITKRQLVEFSKLRQQMMKDRFGDEIALEFTKDPTGVFNSLPRDQKLVIMRMANTSASPVEGASAS